MTLYEMLGEHTGLRNIPRGSYKVRSRVLRKTIYDFSTREWCGSGGSAATSCKIGCSHREVIKLELERMRRKASYRYFPSVKLETLQFFLSISPESFTTRIHFFILVYQESHIAVHVSSYDTYDTTIFKQKL